MWVRADPKGVTMSALHSRFAVLVLAVLAAALAGCNMTVGETATTTPQGLNPAPTLGTDGTEPGDLFITITTPTAADGGPAVVDASGFTVIGAQRGSFENNVIVQALDAGGNVLQQAVTTALGDMGQVGTWEVSMSVQVSAGTPGQIHAFFTSAQDGSVAAETSLDVIYDSATGVDG